MTKQQKKKRLIYIGVVSFWITLFVLIGVISSLISPITAQAIVQSENNFDNTAIEDDLADLDLQYVIDNYTDVSVIELVEYCYSDNVFRQGNYGLYIYVYNPDRITFSVQPGANVVNMAVGYNDDGEPNAYENMPLTYLGKTTGENDGLFYKFKVTDAAELLPVVKEYSKTYGKRRYDIAGIQLRTMGEALAEDYTVGGTWHYAGFAKGYGEDENAESTLDCDVTELTTLSLEVKHTYYRPEGFSGEGVREQDQLNSVYFSIPDDVLNRYGVISEIHAEWYEYRTKPIFVTGNSDVYNAFNKYVGKDISSLYDNGKRFSSEIKYGFAAGYGADINGVEFADYGYNLCDYYLAGSAVNPDGQTLTQLDWLFYASNGAGEKNITSEELQSWAADKSMGKTDLINGKYSMSLFTEEVGERRMAGYNNVHISSDSEYDLSSYVMGDSIWDKLFGNYTSNFSSVKAIETVTEIPSTEDNEKYYVSETDMDDFISYAEQAENNNETVCLFRYALTDYYSVQAYNVENETNFLGIDVTNEIDKDAYLCMENVFLDFDIIDITFCRDGVYTVIPVVSDPIDIFADVTPPPDFEEDGLAWWQILLIVLGVVLAVYLVYKLIKWISGKNTTVTVKYKRNKRKRKRR